METSPLLNVQPALSGKEIDMAITQMDHPVLWEATHHPAIWTVIILGLGLLFAWMMLGGVSVLPLGFGDVNFAA